MYHSRAIDLVLPILALVPAEWPIAATTGGAISQIRHLRRGLNTPLKLVRTPSSLSRAVVDILNLSFFESKLQVLASRVVLPT
ncbi:hypothetical protein F5B17DRAFT_415829 [Nemania serpens]|nr:hypothetical protein F5B17DRAFT_415829 [Nemania serpens]